MPPRSLNTYTANAGDFDNMWRLAYGNTLSQTRLVREEAAETNNLLLRGIAATTEAQIFGMMTALFGDIPYSQASQPEEYPEPAFDPQEQIYAGVQQMLSDAIADFERATELIHIGQAVMSLDGGLDYFLQSVFNYPTLAECYKVAAFNANNKLCAGRPPVRILPSAESAS